MIWSEAVSKAEVTTYRLNPVPVTATELVPPTDCPAVRPSFDGFQLARRLDTGEERSYSNSKRARTTRSRDDDSSRGRAVSKRERDTLSTNGGRSRDRSCVKKGPEIVEATSTGMDWIKLDHIKLARRAEALAKTRTQPPDSDQGPSGTGQSKSQEGGKNSIEAARHVPSQPETQEVMPPPVSTPVSTRANSGGGSLLTPSTLNLSGISLNNSSADAMEIDQFEQEMLVPPRPEENN